MWICVYVGMRAYVWVRQYICIYVLPWHIVSTGTVPLNAYCVCKKCIEHSSMTGSLHFTMTLILCFCHPACCSNVQIFPWWDNKVLLLLHVTSCQNRPSLGKKTSILTLVMTQNITHATVLETHINYLLYHVMPKFYLLSARKYQF